MLARVQRSLVHRCTAHPGGPDVLDGLKARTSLENCGRSNATFADAEGAFVANIDGPVRAIRSYVGANSGPLTQQTLLMYRLRVEVITDLRVHQISGVATYVDFSAAAIGADYGSSELASPVVIDGSPDAVPTSVPSYEWMRSDDGVMLSASTIETSYDLGDDLEQFYEDTTEPTVEESWGDGAFLGAAGPAVADSIPNTDPARGDAETFRARQVFSFWPSGLDADAWAPVWRPQATSGPDVTSRLR